MYSKKTKFQISIIFKVSKFQNVKSPKNENQHFEVDEPKQKRSVEVSKFHRFET